MSYQVKSVFYTLQGEGARAGWPAVFCRFAGCNLWNGRETARDKDGCWFCDTDFVGTNGPGGGRFSSAEELAEHVASFWPAHTDQDTRKSSPYVVLTGGEPLLQVDEPLLQALKRKGFTIAVETNGTVKAPEGIDWITMSPKPGATLNQRQGNELKLVFPHQVTPAEVQELEFEHLYVSPLWVSDEKERRLHVEQTIEFVKENPVWKMTSQFHKVWDIA